MQLSTYHSRLKSIVSLYNPAPCLQWPSLWERKHFASALYDSALAHTCVKGVTGFVDLIGVYLIQGGSGRASQESGS